MIKVESLQQFKVWKKAMKLVECSCGSANQNDQYSITQNSRLLKVVSDERKIKNSFRIVGNYDVMTKINNIKQKVKGLALNSR